MKSTNNITSPLLLEYCESDAFATVSQERDNLMTVRAFIGPTLFSSQQVITGYGITEVCDLKYKKSQQRLDILTHHSDYELYYSQVFFFNQNIIYQPINTVSGFLASDYWLSSLAESPTHFPGGLNMMVTTGFNYDGFITMHRYTPGNLKCWEKSEIRIQELEEYPKNIEESLEKHNVQKEPIILPTTTYTLEMNTICN